ncbi:hypothetical protein COLO4_24514 [Corchorus olitorius]|uniref:Uncharacterized protein n=1 Tax=Corchorus olitorius TaxID=93759 RepID=A0A1R3I9J5_9ROSI|nr:hypothetical protein COLO4_24514 [Corchorus olitorius]
MATGRVVAYFCLSLPIRQNMAPTRPPIRPEGKIHFLAPTPTPTGNFSVQNRPDPT